MLLAKQCCSKDEILMQVFKKYIGIRANNDSNANEDCDGMKDNPSKNTSKPGAFRSFQYAAGRQQASLGVRNRGYLRNHCLRLCC